MILRENSKFNKIILIISMAITRMMKMKILYKLTKIIIFIKIIIKYFDFSLLVNYIINNIFYILLKFILYISHNI